MEVMADTKGISKTTMYIDLSLRGPLSGNSPLPPGCIPPPILITHFKSFLDDIPSAGALINAADGEKDAEYTVGVGDGDDNDNAVAMEE